MGTIRLNMDAVMAQSQDIANAKRTVLEVKSSIDSLYHRIDPKILARNNIGSRLRNTSSQLGSVQNKVGRIQSTVESGVSSYYSTERKASRMAKDISGGEITSFTQPSNSAPWSSYQKFLDVKNPFLKLLGMGVISSEAAYIVSSLLEGEGINKTTQDWKILELPVDFGEIYSEICDFLHPYAAITMENNILGNSLSGLSILSGVSKLANEGRNTYGVFTNENSSMYDKSASILRVGGASANLGKNVFEATAAGSKTLQIISSASGSRSAVNQILVTDQTLAYKQSTAAGNVSAALAVTDVAASTLAGGINRYGQVTADGDFNMGDVGSVGVYASVNGLDAVANSLTFGIVDFDADQAAQKLESDAAAFVGSDNGWAEYIRDQNNNPVLRFGASIGAGACIVGKNIIEGAVAGVNAAGEFISSGWHTAADLFK